MFEWPHLRENAAFLNTQCMFFLSSETEYNVDRPPPVDRMPIVIGDFISRHVYDSKLMTSHAINTLTCCRFVDVRDGEEIKKGVSWMVRALQHG